MVSRMAPVSNAHETKSMRRQYDGPLNTIPLLSEESADLFDGPVSSSYFEQSSGDPAHHATKEGCANHVHPHLVSGGDNVHGEETPHRVFGVVVQFFGERAEIVLPFERPSGEPHGVQIERPSVMMDKPRKLGISRWSGANSVPVEPVDGTKPTVELVGHFRGANHGDIRIQQSIERVRPSLNRDSDDGVEVAYLAARVSAAVRTARSNDLDFLARDSANSFFQCALDGSPSSLRGPAAKIAAVVGDDKLDSHKFSRRVRGRPPERRRHVADRSWSVACSHRFDP